MTASTFSLKQKLFIHDALLITIMGTLAACGLIYEYLMAHYAGRVLGAMESTIYAMIGIMIVSMGVGAFIAKWVKCPFNGFVWLEWAIGFVGATSIRYPRTYKIFMAYTQQLRLMGSLFVDSQDLPTSCLF